MMAEYQYITLREMPEWMVPAAEWFHGKWGVPTEAYLECMKAYLHKETEYGWYLCLNGNQIIGGLGVIENDFHDRKDLTPQYLCCFHSRKFPLSGYCRKFTEYGSGRSAIKRYFSFLGFCFLLTTIASGTTLRFTSLRRIIRKCASRTRIMTSIKCRGTMFSLELMMGIGALVFQF